MDSVIKILIPATILLIPAYLLKFTLFGIPTNVLEILVLASFISYLIKRGSTSLGRLGREKLNLELFEFYKNNKAIAWGVLVMFAGFIISTLANGEYRTGFGIIKGWLVIPLMFSWVLYVGSKNEQNLKSILKWLYWGIFGVAAVSLGYYFLGELTYDGRLRGFYLSPNYLAMYLAPAIMIGLWLVQMQNAKCKSQNDNLKCKIISISYLLSLFAIITALYLTYSYMTWAAIIVSLLIINLITKRKISKQSVLVGIIVVLLIIISKINSEKFINLTEFTRSSLESRIMIWKSASKILMDNPIWGIGPGNFQNKYLEYQKYFPPYLEWAVPQPHNLYMAFWLQTGLLGLLSFLFIMAKWLKDMVQAQKNSQVAAALLGIIIYFLLHGFLDTPYWKNDLAVVFWIIIILGLKAKQIAQVSLQDKL